MDPNALLRFGANAITVARVVASMNDFLIAVPSLDTQRQIVALNRLWEQEQVLTQKLLQNREQMMQGVFQQLLKE